MREGGFVCGVGAGEESKTLWSGWSDVLCSHSELTEEQVALLGQYHIDLPLEACAQLVQDPRLRIPRTQSSIRRKDWMFQMRIISTSCCWNIDLVYIHTPLSADGDSTGMDAPSPQR